MHGRTINLQSMHKCVKTRDKYVCRFCLLLLPSPFDEHRSVCSASFLSKESGRCAWVQLYLVAVYLWFMKWGEPLGSSFPHKLINEAGKKRGALVREINEKRFHTRQVRHRPAGHLSLHCVAFFFFLIQAE